MKRFSLLPYINLQAINSFFFNRKPTKCTCSHTNCLKCYCVCYKSGRCCTDQCSCVSCKNRTQSLASSRQPKKEVKQESFHTACKCKKECKKMYCDCRKHNKRCTELCSCQNCQNDKIDRRMLKSETEKLELECERSLLPTQEKDIEMKEGEKQNDEKSMVFFNKYFFHSFFILASLLSFIIFCCLL